MLIRQRKALADCRRQSNWSKNQVTKIRQAIGNVLRRDSYLGTQWERVKLGTYRALN